MPREVDLNLLIDSLPAQCIIFFFYFVDHICCDPGSLLRNMNTEPCKAIGDAIFLSFVDAFEFL